MWFVMSLAAPLGLALVIPRWWVVWLAAGLPVLAFWAEEGLSGTSRDGYENWGLLALPFICLVWAGVIAAVVALRIRMRKRSPAGRLVRARKQNEK